MRRASLSANVHKVVLYGSGKENIEFKYITIAAIPVRRRLKRVLHNMERRYKRDGIQRGARRAGEVHQ